MYVLVDESSESYFVDPSFDGWKFTNDILKATKFNDIDQATRIAAAVNRASAMTYWDYDDIPPHAIVKSVK